METVIFFSNNRQSFSYNELLAQISDNDRSIAIHLLKKTIAKHFQMQLRPWKTQIVDSKLVNLFQISTTDKSLIGLTMDDFLQTMQNFGLKLFTEKMVNDLTIRFESLSNVKFELIVPIDVEYKKLVRVGERNQGDEFDGPFDYNYAEKLFTVITSDNTKHQKPIVIDDSYKDKHYKNRLTANQHFLFYLEVDQCIDANPSIKK